MNQPALAASPRGSASLLAVVSLLALLGGCCRTASPVPAQAAPLLLPPVRTRLALPLASGRVDLVAAASPALALPTLAPVAPPPCVVEPEAGEPPGLHRRDRFARGEVVLTFDDGPYADKTPRVLDQLAARSFQATFFLLGRHITRRTFALVQRMEAEGHVIGSHSYDHDIEMARRPGKQTIEYIRGQHEATRLLVEIALLARSADDFDALYRRVFQAEPNKRIGRAALRDHHREYAARHRAILAERGQAAGRYRVLYSRPPGGGPYLGRAKGPRERYDEALRQLGMMNVMWHSQSGDVDPHEARSYGFLTRNLASAARRGGVVLIHDFIRGDALASALSAMTKGSVRVLSLSQATRRKYHCPGGPLPVATAHFGSGMMTTSLMVPMLPPAG